VKELQDLCDYLAKQIQNRQITEEELADGLQQVWDALPGSLADEKLRRARRRVGTLLRAARSKDTERRRDLLGAHIDLLQVGLSLKS
jgi:hypothetical protein